MVATRIRIQKKRKTVPGKEAVLLTYDTTREQFASRSERNKFYRGLHGFEQTVKQNGKIYHYEKDGVLDMVPHAKVADTVFVIPRKEFPPVKQYFKKWGDKVNHRTYRIHLSQQEWSRLHHNTSR